MSSNSLGVAINKTTFVYGDATRTESFCSLPCDHVFKTRWDLDSTGNVIKAEEDNPMTVMPVDRMEVYKYLSFDLKGNWTKREINGHRTTSLTTTEPIHYIEYRTIKYY